MPEVTQYEPGSFSWADLATKDAEAAKKFYTGLFGWNATDNPAGEGMIYTMFDKGGKNVSALYNMGEDMLGQGIPPHWQSYITIENADESAKKVESLNGKVMMPPMDVFDAGRMLMAQDPTGAVVAMWQPKEHIGSQLNNEPGTIAWNELQTKNTEAASEFYTGMFGWDVEKTPMPEGPVYNAFKVGEEYKAGMVEIQPDWGEVPPNWSVYFTVENCDDSVMKAEGLGGTKIYGPVDLDFGRFAFIADPQGAAFAVFQFTGEMP